jgi:hypothetical protein
MNTLRRIVARYQGWLWNMMAERRDVRGAIAVKRPDRARLDHIDGRRQFWAEFREGQRQAEDKCWEVAELKLREG